MSYETPLLLPLSLTVTSNLSTHLADSRGVLKLKEQMGVARLGRPHQSQHVAQQLSFLPRGAGVAASGRVFGERALAHDEVRRHEGQHVRHQGGPGSGLMVDKAAGLEELVRVIANIGLSAFGWWIVGSTVNGSRERPFSLAETNTSRRVKGVVFFRLILPAFSACYRCSFDARTTSAYRYTAVFRL